MRDGQLERVKADPSVCDTMRSASKEGHSQGCSHLVTTATPAATMANKDDLSISRTECCLRALRGTEIAIESIGGTERGHSIKRVQQCSRPLLRHKRGDRGVEARGPSARALAIGLDVLRMRGRSRNE